MGALLSPAGGAASPTLIRGATVVNADAMFRADVRLREGRIAELGILAPTTGEDVLDATGCLVLPGAIDIHVHLDDEVNGIPIADDMARGTAAAAAGGVTTVVTFVTQRPGERVLEAVTRMEHATRDRVHCHVGFHLTPTGASWDWEGIDAALDRGVRTLKLYTTYKRAGIYSSYDQIEAVMLRLAARDAGLLVHCEDEVTLAAAATLDIDPRDPRGHGRRRPEAAEIAAVDRVAAAAARTGCRTHIVHVSTAAAAQRIATARAAGAPVTAETCPQYLLLNDAALAPPDGHRRLCTPPLRSEATRAALEARFVAGDLDLLASDHCPYTRAAKDRHRDDFRMVPNGLPGVGALLPLAWEVLVVRNGRSPTEVVERVSAAPARLLGLADSKGAIRPGADADLAVLATSGPAQPVAGSWSEVWSPWAGLRTRCTVSRVFVAGA